MSPNEAVLPRVRSRRRRRPPFGPKERTALITFIFSITGGVLYVLGALGVLPKWAYWSVIGTPKPVLLGIFWCEAAAFLTGAVISWHILQSWWNS